MVDTTAEELAVEEGVVDGIGEGMVPPVGVVTSPDPGGGGPDISLFIGLGLILAAIGLS